MFARVLRLVSHLLLACAGMHMAYVHAAIPVGAEFVSRAGDPRGGDAGFNTFQRLPDGRGITFGGFSHDRNGNNAVVVYDPVADTWQTLQPNLPWVDTYDVSGRSFLGNRDDHVTLVVDGQYWAIDGQRGVPLVGNYRGVFDVASRAWTIDDVGSAFSPTGAFFGVWMLSAADWHASLDVGYIFGGLVNGNPTDGLLLIERNPPASTTKFRFTEYRRLWDDQPSFDGAERLYYLNNQHWQRGRFVHVYGGQQQLRYVHPDTRVDSRNLWQLELSHPPRLTVLSTNTLPDGQRVQGNKLYAYHDPNHDIVVISNGKLVNVYDYATGLWHYVSVLTPADSDRESPSPQGAGRAGFYSPEVDQYIILGGHGRVYGLKLNFGGATAPDPPANVAATAGNASVTVTFAGPSNNGGAAITGYNVTSIPGGGVDVRAGTLATSRTITGLANGTAYRFTVAATNAVGTSAPSAASNVVTPSAPPTVPGAPRNVAATSGNTSATISFLPPLSDGGSPITRYTVTSSPAGGVDQHAGTAATTRMISGLANGTSYTFTVIATNGVGTGPASAPSSAVVPAAPVVVPGAARNVAAVAGNSSATITFDAPASDGGSPIARYTVLVNPPGGVDQQAGTAATTRAVTGLVNGTTYTFTVTATNAVGTGPASMPSNAVTPAAPAVPPGAPLNVLASAGDGSATIAFSPPSNDGGSPILDYTVLSSPPGAIDGQAGTTATLRTVTGLVNGVTYVFTVTARNAVGAGKSAASNPVTPTAVSSVRTAMRDFDGTLTSDVVWHNDVGGRYSIWLMNGASVLATIDLMTGANRVVTHAADFDGDGRDDLILRDLSSGATIMQRIGSRVVADPEQLLLEPDWRVTHVGDFDGNRNGDLLWRNDTTGLTSLWLMDGSALRSGAELLHLPDWKVTTVADFNGDGMSDLLWFDEVTGETAIWIMDGTAYVRGSIVLADARWRAVLSGDLNGDGRADLVWRNSVTGEVALWLMDGTEMITGTVVMGSGDWEPLQAIDFSGDGRADILWRNRSTGAGGLWLMDGLKLIAGGALNIPAQAESTVGDYDADGKVDILWHVPGSNTAELWLMNGLVVKASSTLGSGSDWSVVP